ncbi:diacylglycerol kinase [Paenibacillus tarimensis]
MRRLLRSIGYAAQGFGFAVRTQRNMKIHLGAATAVSLLAALLGLSRLEWVLLIGACIAVIAMELVNTAIECIVNLVKPDPHPMAKVAKDTAAAAVLVCAAGAAAIGLIVLLPPLIKLVH